MGEKAFWGRGVGVGPSQLRAPLPRPLRAHAPRSPSVPPPMDGVKRTPSPDVLAAWRRAAAVCFDVDSTLCADESIDELAAFLGVGDAVADLTNK